MSRKSVALYATAYDQFKKWRLDNGYDTVDEDMLLTYFEQLSEKVSPVSLRPVYSMLKSTLQANEAIDIGSYERLMTFVKDKSVGYGKNEAKSFTSENLATFLSEAPDHIYLATKVALIFGVAGALKRQDFVDIKVDDILDGDGIIFIKIPNVKDEVPRFFTVDDEILYDLCKKYIECRPTCDINRFFLRYVDGKCIPIPIGINSFASMPQTIAKFLGLSETEKFTGHSFRKTPANFLVDAVKQMRLMKKRIKQKSHLVSWDISPDPQSNEEHDLHHISSSGTASKRFKSQGIKTVQMAIPYSNSRKSNHWVELCDVNNGNEGDEDAELGDESNMTVDTVEPEYLHEASDVSEEVLQMDHLDDERSEITITKDDIIETVSVQGQNKRVISLQPRITSLHQSGDDFQEQNDGSFNSHKSFVFNNCNVTIVDGSHNTFVFNNCNITNATESIQD
ncbi:hypothetical protein QAD02_000548 [Eretmocerus hayati]|uniref:Uncharacterized protein n=1 Tax=Eretmocerus hayati TaxID=131215 RepID=A0ACC2NG24_9HYME|nr:hypothetical protein QAD02_000548 [Eretmocerus hayati]